jgi:hypothetical protein
MMNEKGVNADLPESNLRMDEPGLVSRASVSGTLASSAKDVGTWMSVIKSSRERGNVKGLQWSLDSRRF